MVRCSRPGEVWCTLDGGGEELRAPLVPLSLLRAHGTSRAKLPGCGGNALHPRPDRLLAGRSHASVVVRFPRLGRGSKVSCWFTSCMDAGNRTRLAAFLNRTACSRGCCQVDARGLRSYVQHGGQDTELRLLLTQRRMDVGGNLK